MKNLEIFDLDRTLVRKNTSFCFYFHLLEKRIVKKRTFFKVLSIFLRARFGFLSLSEIHKKVFSTLMKGQNQAQFAEEAKNFLDRFLDRNFNRSILHRFQLAKERGDETFLLSSSPDFIVREIAVRLGFDHWKGTEYFVDKEGRICEIASLIEGMAKLQAARQIPCKQATAYSDSADDVPLLEWAKHAVVVQASRSLKRLARKKNWEILS